MKLPYASAVFLKPQAFALVRELTGVSVGLLLCLAIGAGFPAASVAQETDKPLIVLIGPPGSGKSTQAARIQRRHRFALITREQLMADDPFLLARYKQPDMRVSSHGLILRSINSFSSALNKPTSAVACCSTATRRPKATPTS